MKRRRKGNLSPDTLREHGLAVPICWLPDHQEPHQLGPLPGKPDKGLWFEGPSKLKHKPEPKDILTEEEEHELEATYFRKKSTYRHPTGTGQRDVRRGEAWLSWHTAEE